MPFHQRCADFLDRENGSGSVAGYCIGILAAAIVVFVIVHYLQLLRQRFTEKKVDMTRLGSTRHDDEALELGQVTPHDSKIALN